MEYRTLGRTGVRVSTLCLGAMMFGAWGNTDHDECVTMIHHALDSGINFIDTADVYAEGESEKIVGKAIASRRDEVVLATKVHGRMGEGPNRSGNSRRWIMAEVEDSLRRLGTDHIDLYQIHRPDPATDISETLGALDDLIHQGKVRYIGSSTFAAFQIVESHWAAQSRGLVGFHCEQPPYSIFVRHIERDVLHVCRGYGMGVIVWSPLAGGWLTGKYRREGDPPRDSRAARYKGSGRPVAARYDVDNPDNAPKFDAVERLAAVADKAGLSMTHMAQAWVLHHPEVTAAIVGPRTPRQLDDALTGADVRLGDEILDAIDEIVPPGSVLAAADRGWTEPWMEPDERRIRAGAARG